MEHKLNWGQVKWLLVFIKRQLKLNFVNSGDHDMMVPFLATQAWIRSLNYPIVDDWRPWYSNGQIAGYVPQLQYTLITSLDFYMKTNLSTHLYKIRVSYY